MSSIYDALSSISLEKYSEAFASSGFSTFEELTTVNPNDLDKVFNDIGMLKGHTFKLKKMIEDFKSGGAKPKPAASMPATPLVSPLKVKQDAVNLSTKVDIAKPMERVMNKDNFERPGGVKAQLDNVIQTKESMISSLKQFLELDLTPYTQAISQLRNMQNMIKDLLQPDIEMIN